MSKNMGKTVTYRSKLRYKNTKWPSRETSCLLRNKRTFVTTQAKSKKGIISLKLLQRE